VRHQGAGAASLAGLAAASSSDPRTRAIERVSGERGVPAGGAVVDDPAEDHPDVLQSRNGPDQRQDRRRRSSRAAWITVFFVAVLLVLAGGYVLLDNLSDDRAEPEVAAVVVPELVGMAEADATDAIVDAGLIPSSDEQYNATVETGSVISSDPSAGASVPAESRVNITVSQGPANIVLPGSLAGLTESSARDQLEEFGLRGGTVTEETSAEVAEGRVITTSPQAGQTVPVGSPVDLVLSNGKVVVPLLTDLTVQQAEALLADPAVQLPFTVREEENSVVAPGIVTEQSAEARSQVDQGTEIVLTVAKAPVAPTPEPTEPGPTPSGQPGEQPSGQPTEGPDDDSETRPTEDGT
jgi:beta-lactam-binding protein with PASTA domain